MSRSKWKGAFLNNAFLKQEKKNISLIWSKNSTITGDLKGQRVLVYNGKDFKKLFITGSKIGFKFGHFIFTRKYTAKSFLKTNKKK